MISFSTWKDRQSQPAIMQQLFSRVAPRYDFAAKALSFFQDRRWKRELLDGLKTQVNNGVLLDCATGTGDLILSGYTPNRYSVALGVDICLPMLSIASKRRAVNVHFSWQDMNMLSLKESTVDCITGGYALRNVYDVSSLFKELHRVMKPDGMAAFIEFSKPPAKVVQGITVFLLWIWGGIWGLLLHANPFVYAYLGSSLRRFPDTRQLDRIIVDSGFSLPYRKNRMFGLIQLIWFKKR
ncbi:MAG: class I SAM-dependent methyltransferase [Chitinivibrionales bacterium]|nr:class I SAM-dependent methyltransferase [Chitinivibrionales bacterium]